jgi:hypothetical protein
MAYTYMERGMAQETGGQTHEFRMFYSTYRYPSRTWFSARVLLTMFLWIGGFVVLWFWSFSAGVILLFLGIGLAFYVLEKGYLLGRGDNPQKWDRIPIDTPSDERASSYGKAYKKGLTLSLALLLVPWFSLPIAAWLGLYSASLLLTPILFITFFAGINGLERAMYYRRMHRALVN